MKAVTFDQEFRFRTGPAETRFFPKGWRGPVDDAIAAAARKAGVLETPKRRNAKPAAKQDGDGSAKGGAKGDDSDAA